MRGHWLSSFAEASEHTKYEEAPSRLHSLPLGLRRLHASSLLFINIFALGLERGPSSSGSLEFVFPSFFPVVRHRLRPFDLLWRAHRVKFAAPTLHAW